MRKLLAIGAIIFSCVCVHAQEDYTLAHVIEDICTTASEQGIETDYEDLQEQLYQLSREKININQATAEDLQQLYFLSDEKIDKVLIYRDQHPVMNIYELQLIPGLREWEYRFLALFVEAGEQKSEKIYARELFQQAKHEVDLRVDARNLEDYQGDPVYTSIKYRLQSHNKIAMGITMERDAGEPFSGHKIYGFDHYGGYLQLNDIWRFKTIVVGDYKAHFGMGLVVSGQMRLGKTSYISNLGFGTQGLRKYSGNNETDFFRGAGTTLRLGPVDVSAWYSYKGVDANLQNGVFPSVVSTGYHRTATEISHKKTVGQHVAGVNVNYTHKSFRLGITAVENIFSDTLRPKPTYYNTHYFSGKRQTVLGAYAQWSIWRMQLFAEAATAENTRWGIGTLAGMKMAPVNDVHLVAIGRYYSPYFDNMLAAAFGETSKNNDELGLYLGTEITVVKNWRFAVFADMYKFSGPKYSIPDTTGGYELQAEAEWQVNKSLQMILRGKWKDKAAKEKAQLRYQLCYQTGGLSLTTRLEGTICHQPSATPTLGAMIMQDVEYQWLQVPITLQVRGEVFDIRHWDNRIYAFENDVLYAFSCPADYGVGGRWYVNGRYKIGEHYSLYLKVAETVFAKSWMNKQSLASRSKTDIHLLLRITY